MLFQCQYENRHLDVCFTKPTKPQQRTADYVTVVRASIRTAIIDMLYKLIKYWCVESRPGCRPIKSRESEFVVVLVSCKEPWTPSHILNVFIFILKFYNHNLLFFSACAYILIIQRKEYKQH